MIMNIDLEKEQQLFEVFARTQGLQLLKWDSDDYASESTQLAWDSWLASVNRKGYKLLPTEATEEMIDAAIEAIVYDKSYNLMYEEMVKVYK